MDAYIVVLAGDIEINDRRFPTGATEEMVAAISRYLHDEASRGELARLKSPNGASKDKVTPSKLGTGIVAGVQEGCRLLQCGPYRCIYWVDETNKIITVKTIR